MAGHSIPADTMNDNPYEAPPSGDDREPRNVPPTREARLVVLAILLFASLMIARLVHAGNLPSIFVSSIPIFLLCVVAYYFGLRHGAD